MRTIHSPAYSPAHSPILIAAAGLVAAAAAFTGAAGCSANDPLYMPGPMVMDAGQPDPASMNGALTTAKASLLLPIKTETDADKKARAALAAKLAPVKVPYVKIGDLEIEVEWTIKNLDSKPGQAMIELNGANEFFSYDPSIIKLNPNDREAPPTPGLSGDIPLDIPAGGELSGQFTEDQVREAAIDLDAITRGNLSPFAAEIQINKNEPSFQPMTPLMPTVANYMQTATGPAVPRDAFAEFVRIDLVFRPTTHMTLSYDVRVRDLRGIMHELLLAAETQDPGQLAKFDPMVFNVAAPTTPPPASN